jgi:dipeptidyl aminopeptidase/acylaminoacyl peptidase
MFTALIDMYGISNIASYFGGGTWGYWYGDLALPGSLPWKDKDIFVEKSPLYHADKIKTPMLILHGAADNNVPPTESDQMFVALKILGQDVAYVRFEGEHHNIVDKFDNLIAHREMMLEWFDKYLKGEPEGWEKRWKE